ncbi:serine hydrolase domain-containing protein [Embleya sp. NPDC005971]|uniref:serine hydrolase domain-containing protein n=1 Tax=unclassified Embleya TaxID=2699296 RepID=UPI00340B710B
MRRLRTSLLGAAVGLAVLAATAQPSTASSVTAAQAFRTGADQGIVAGYPGVMGLIVDGATNTYVKAGSNVRGSATPLDTNAKFRIASNTKTFTSAVVLQLEAEGKLSLNDTVAHWLPNAVNSNGYDGNTITIRELLNQRSGLPDYMAPYNIAYYGAFNVDQSYTPQELINSALAQRPAALPRVFEYANTNYMLAGMIITAVTGHTPSVEITNRIITPLNLTNTSYPETSPDIYGNFMRGWRWPPPLWGGYQPPLADSTRSNTQLFGPAGAIISTLQDQVTFERALLQGQVLAPTQLAEMKTSIKIENYDNEYGLGMTRVKATCNGATQWFWSHGGDEIGYHSRWFATEDGSKQIFYAANENHGLGLTESAGQQALQAGALNAMCELLKP